MTPKTTIELLDNLRAGRPVKVGPQNGQQDCEGPDGRTTLHKPEETWKPITRDLKALKKELDAEKAAAAK